MPGSDTPARERTDSCDTNDDSADRAVALLRALGHQVRFGIVQLLADCGARTAEEDPCGECEVVCARRLQMRFCRSAPDLGHHLKVLREAGLVETVREGALVYYVAVPGALASLSAVIEALDCQSKAEPSRP